MAADRPFKIVSEYEPRGDQPKAIKELVDGLKRGDKHQTLLGITGSGKTYTAAYVIEAMQRPTLIMAHNKTLAAQLYGEFKELFPENAVEYFVSYYDYYQPEAYVVADRHVHREGLDHQRGDRSHAPRGDARGPVAPRRHHRRVGVVHLRHRRSRTTTAGWSSTSTSARSCAATRCCAGWSTCSTSATTSTSTAARSACAATSSRSSPPTRRRPRCASSSSATRSRRSARSIRCAARSSGKAKHGAHLPRVALRDAGVAAGARHRRASRSSCASGCRSCRRR